MRYGGLVLGLTWGWFNLDRHGGGGISVGANMGVV